MLLILDKLIPNYVNNSPDFIRTCVNQYVTKNLLF